MIKERAKLFLKELVLLSVIPIAISLTISVAYAAIVLFPLPWAFTIVISLILTFFIYKIGKFNFKSLIRAFIYTTLIFSAMHIDSTIQFNKKTYIRQHNIPDLILMKKAIYTNDENICHDLKTELKKVCLNSFKLSYDSCIVKYDDLPRSGKERTTDGRNYGCMSNVLYLTDNLEGCKNHLTVRGCEEDYAKKYYQYALLKRDLSLCQKFNDYQNPEQKIRYDWCKKDLYKIEKLGGEYFENKYDASWPGGYDDFKFIYDLFKEGKIKI